MIQREHYIEEIRPFYESDLIKIITGIRRCGKSVIMEQIIKEVAERTDNIIYLNFEDKKILDLLTLYSKDGIIYNMIFMEVFCEIYFLECKWL